MNNLNKEQAMAFELIANTNTSFFLTGRAGTGKTTFLHTVQNSVEKDFIILAPTGIAAILAGGDTIHSFFGLPLTVCDFKSMGKMNQANIDALYHADTIIIDEVSMVRCDIIDAIDRTMRCILHNNVPFGGKQMVFIGDMFQLPPVVKSGAEKEHLKDLYGSDSFFFYKANAIKKIRLPKIEFTKVYRQDDDNFLKILENIRMNKASHEDVSLLNTRIKAPLSQDMIVTLSSTNKAADKINEERLNELETPEFTFEGEIVGRFEEKKYPVDLHLRLKVGAQVMFTRNDQNRRWANGTLATVFKLSDNEIIVELKDGSKHSVSQCSWDSIKYEYDRNEKKLKKEICGTFTQYPLKLAWGITIHKSQGMTFEKLNLDLSSRIFATGQLYVALSRVRSLDGLYLTNYINPKDAVTDPEIISYAQEFNDSQIIKSEIESGKASFEALKNGDYDFAAKSLLKLCHQKASNCKLRDALTLAKRVLTTVIDDEILFGSITDVPQIYNPLLDPNLLILSAMLNLYAGQYEEALAYADAAYQHGNSADSLYLKSRALAKLGRFKEADDVNIAITEDFDMNTPDSKILFMVAMINEKFVGDPGLSVLRDLVIMRPEYTHSLITLRDLMREKGLKLSGPDSQLIIDFNSDMPDDEFQSVVTTHRQSASEDWTKFIKELESMKL